MSFSEGGFVLRQILSSSVVLGPLLLLVALFFLLYKQERKAVVFYFVSGTVLTIVGVACLYSEFRLSARGEGLNAGGRSEYGIPNTDQ